MRNLRHGALALAGLLAASLPSAGRAASFDCAKATLPHDKLICADQGLSHADGTLAALYAQARDKLSPEGQRLLQEGQRGWLRYLRAVCPLQGPGAAPPAEATKCLAAEYDQRIKSLGEAVVQAGAFRFMRVESYEAHWPAKGDDPDDPDSDPTADKDIPLVPVTRSVSVLRIDDPASPAITQLNGVLAARARELTEDVDKLTSVGIDAALPYVSPQLASLTLNWYVYRRGAAHPNHGSRMVDLLPGAGREMKATDLFDDGKPWADALAALTFGGLKAQAEKDDFPLVPEQADDIRDLTADPGRWLLDAAGLTIHFDVYEVASYADGDKEVTLPWSALKPYLVADPPFPIPLK